MNEVWGRYQFKSSLLYSCSPRRVSKKLLSAYETVSCMQQLRVRYALRTCYYARASLWRQLKPGGGPETIA